MQMVIEIPDALKGVGEAVRAMIWQVEAAWRSTRGGRAVEYLEIERQLADGAAAIERVSPTKQCCRAWMGTSPE